MSEPPAASLPVVIQFAAEPPRRKPVARGLTPVDPLSTGNALRRYPRSGPIEPLFVLIDGTLLPVPHDPAAETRAKAELEGVLLLGSIDDGDETSPLAEFVEACYRFGGWVRIAAVQWQLDQLPGVLMTSGDFAARMLATNPPPADIIEAMVGGAEAMLFQPFGINLEDRLLPPTIRAAPPYWALRLAETIRRLSPERLDPTRARYEDAARRARYLSLAFRTKVLWLRAKIYRLLGEVESAAQVAAKSRLRWTSLEMLNQGWRLLGEYQGQTFEHWRERDVDKALSYRPTRDGVDFLRLVPLLEQLALAVQRAEDRLFVRVLTGHVRALLQAAAKGATAPGPPAATLATVVSYLESVYADEQTAEVQALRQQLSDAQAALARELTTATVRFPVLFRFSIKELVAATLLDEPALLKWVYLKLTEGLAASAAMLERFSSNGSPLALKGSPPATVADTEYELVLAEDVEDSVWTYPKAIDDALGNLFVDELSLAGVATQRMLQAVARRAAEREQVATAVSVLESSLTTGLTVVCPPVGFAVDVGFGIADLVSAISIYKTQSDEYYCALNPIDSFAEAEPSMFPVALAVAGVALTVAFP